MKFDATAAVQPLTCSGLNEGTCIRIVREVLEELKFEVQCYSCTGGDTVKYNQYLM